MPDQRLVFILEFHRDHVEPAGDIEEFGMLGQVPERDFADLTAFSRRHRFFRKTETEVGSCLDLDENQGRAVLGDDVDFPPAKAESAFDDLEAFPDEVTDGRLFAAAA